MNEYAAIRRQQQDVAERLEEIRNEFLWSERGLEWFEDWMRCNASADIAKQFHQLLRGVDVENNRKTIKRRVEEFCEDAEYEWMRHLAEDRVAEDAQEAA